jgi:hypothetical protein
MLCCFMGAMMNGHQGLSALRDTETAWDSFYGKYKDFGLLSWNMRTRRRPPELDNSYNRFFDRHSISGSS